MGFILPKEFLFFVGGLLYLLIRIILYFIKNRTNKEYSIKREIIYGGIFLYLIVLIGITLFPLSIGGRRIEADYYSNNFVPVFNTIKDIATDINSREDMKSFFIIFWMKNIIGNLFLLIPLGIILSLYTDKFKSTRKAIIIGFSVSLTIEIFQYLSCFIGKNYRSADIDDLILNTLGCALGFIFYKLLIKNRKVESLLKVN